jgi:hypothetical protein
MVLFEAIAADAIATLTAHITKKVSGKLAEKIEEIYQKVKEKLSSDPYANQTLKRVEEDPMSERRQSTLEDVVSEKMEEDPNFAEEIKRLVEEVKKIPGSSNVIASGQGAVAIRGNVSGSPIITGNNNVVGERGSGKD